MKPPQDKDRGKFFRVVPRSDIAPELHNKVVQIIGWLKREHCYSCRLAETGGKVKVYANDLK